MLILEIKCSNIFEREKVWKCNIFVNKELSWHQVIIFCTICYFNRTFLFLILVIELIINKINSTF